MLFLSNVLTNSWFSEAHKQRLLIRQKKYHSFFFIHAVDHSLNKIIFFVNREVIESSSKTYEVLDDILLKKDLLNESISRVMRTGLPCPTQAFGDDDQVMQFYGTNLICGTAR
jgi:hypothetical protein